MKEDIDQGRLCASKLQALSIAICIAAFSYPYVSSHHFLEEGVVIVFLAIFFLTCLLLGRTIAFLLPVKIEGVTEFPILFLLGFYCFCLLTLAFCFVSPFPLLVNFLLVVVLAVVAQHAVGWKQRRDTSSFPVPADSILSVVCIAVSAAASLIWTHASRVLYIVQGDHYIFPQWVDVFFHSSIFTIFLEDKNSTGLERPWMAGSGLWLYHFASYLPASIFVGLTHFSPIEIYSRFYVPSAYFIAALSAYTLARQWWSQAAATVAAAAVILLPDSSWQGLTGNYYYGFLWVLQASPGLGLGLGLLVLAWIMMFSACFEGNRRGVLCSFICAGLLIFFRFQLFVGSGLLLWFFPIFFLNGLVRRTRIIWLMLATAMLLGSIGLAVHLNLMPTPGINLSGFQRLAAAIVQLPGGIYYFNLMQSWPLLGLLLSVAYLFFAVLGWWGLAWVLLVYLDPANRRPLLKLIFPPLAFIYFSICNLFLESSTWLFDEFSHRPFVWPYLVTATFVSAGFYTFVVERWSIPRPALKLYATGALALGFLFPVLFNQRIINPMQWTETTNVTVDRGFIACGQFLAENSSQGDVIQDIGTDPNYVLTAWSGRHEWVSLLYPLYKGVRTRDPENLDRVKQIQDWSLMTDATKINAFASRQHIRWVIIDPGVLLNWPDSLLQKTVFESSGYKVLRFD